jgi:aspartate dehydrogenase
VIGRGSIGGTVSRLLEHGAVAGCTLSGVLTRDAAAGALDALLGSSDTIVEAAGHKALTRYGPGVVSAGVDLLVVSVGALVDDRLLDTLQSGGEGRLLLSAGAIGGLELLRAAALLGPLDSVSLESTKRSAVLVRPWMEPDLVSRLEADREPVEVFAGSAREAATRFPESANVAATLGLATIGLDATRVLVMADRAARRTRHTIRAAGAAGAYAITIENNPSPENPRTSGITPYAVVRALQDLRAGMVVGV